MLQISNLSEYKEEDIQKLYDKVKPILDKRKQLHEKYTRSANERTVLFSSDESTTKLPFEKFMVDLATGYTSGKPVYAVRADKDKKASEILEKTFNKKIVDDDYVKGMEVAIKYITSFNDDEQENYDLIHDIFEMTSCYEVVYETEINGKNEIVYSRFSPLQTVATWDYSIPANLTGLIRVWTETDLEGKELKKIELTDKLGTRQFEIDSKKKVKLEKVENHAWGDVPAFAVETDFALFEPCEDVISAYEQIVQNVRNTYQYNDSDCKLIIEGYSPDEPLLVTDDNGNVVQNPARVQEDRAWQDSKTIYVGEGGAVSWLSKPMDATGVEKTIKIYQDLMFQLAGLPNTSDLSFSGSDLNTSAIDRKFYIMKMATASVVALLKKAYLRRWELIFNRLNLKNSTEYDFRDIVIELPKNLPNNSDELINSMLKLKGTISDETIINKLGYDYTVEKQNMEEETSDKILTNIENMQQMRNSGLDNSDIQDNSLFNHYDTSQKGVENESLDENRQDTEINLTGN